MTGSRPEYGLDFTDPDVNRYPWPHLGEMRELAAAVFNAPSNSWFVTSYEDVRAVYANDADFAPATKLIEEMFGDPTVVGSDSPRHEELRGVLNPYLLRGAVKRWVELMGELADQQLTPIIERLRDGESVDAIPYLRMIPAQLIARIMGVPAEDSERLSEWSQRMVYMFDAHSAPGTERAAQLQEAGIEAKKALHEYFGEQLEMRRREGSVDDLLGVLATTDVPMSDHEKLSYVTLLIEGAQDTTTKFMAASLVALGQHPEQRRALVEDRALMRSALDEVIRWQGPVFLSLRVSRHHSARVGNVLIPAGDTLSLMLGAANRDPSRWERPEDFDMAREFKANLGFGFGRHSCMGINLARLETEIFINKLLDAIPDYQLVAEPVDYGRSINIRGPASLRLVL
jgi:cytochrome P450